MMILLPCIGTPSRTLMFSLYLLYWDTKPDDSKRENTDESNMFKDNIIKVMF